MGSSRVQLVVSGRQESGDAVSPDAVRMAYAGLGRAACVDSKALTDFALEQLADGRVAITARLHLIRD